jgi:hypothetical protein
MYGLLIHNKLNTRTASRWLCYTDTSEGVQQACPRKTSSLLHRFESQKSCAVILIETGLRISFFLLFIIPEFAVAINFTLV